MAKHKSYQTYTPTEASTFDVNGTSFKLRPSVPGIVLLDFMSGLDEDNAAGTVKVVKSLLNAAIDPTDLERFDAFIRDPANNVTLNTLSEIAGYISERMAGNPTNESSDPFSTG